MFSEGGEASHRDGRSNHTPRGKPTSGELTHSIRIGANRISETLEGIKIGRDKGTSASEAASSFRWTIRNVFIKTLRVILLPYFIRQGTKIGVSVID